MARSIRATKLDLLRYIRSHGFVEPWQIRDYFGYSDKNAARCLSRLKKRGLVINMQKGQWEVTYEGDKKLAYFEELDKNKQIAARKAKRIEIAKGTYNKP